LAVAVALALANAVGCRSLPPATPVDLSEPGWTISHGQAIWHPKSGADGIAGELFVGLHADGRSVVQFTKTPLLLVEAQRGANFWRIQFCAQNRSYAGRGQPPRGLLWLQLPQGLAGHHLEGDWRFTQHGGGSWRLENRRTGEALDGFLAGVQ